MSEESTHTPQRHLGSGFGHASTAAEGSSSPALAGKGGVYCEDCDIADPTDHDSPLARYQGVDAHAVDRDAARRLWERSAELTGVNAFG